MPRFSGRRMDVTPAASGLSTPLESSPASGREQSSEGFNSDENTSSVIFRSAADPNGIYAFQNRVSGKLPRKPTSQVESMSLGGSSRRLQRNRLVVYPKLGARYMLQEGKKGSFAIRVNAPVHRRALIAVSIIGRARIKVAPPRVLPNRREHVVGDLIEVEMIVFVK